MKKRSLKINLAIAALAAVIGSLFLISPANVPAESYSAPPQQVTFGHTYTGTINTTEDMYRYNVTLKKPGTVKINITLSNPDSETRSLIIKVYSNSGKLLYKKLVDKSHSVIAANLKKGRYYIVADGMMGTYKTTTFKLKPSYKGFPASSVKKLSNKAKKKLKVTWTKKISSVRLSGSDRHKFKILKKQKIIYSKKKYHNKQNIQQIKKIKKILCQSSYIYNYIGQNKSLFKVERDQKEKNNKIDLLKTRRTGYNLSFLLIRPKHSKNY